MILFIIEDLLNVKSSNPKSSAGKTALSGG